MPLLTGILLGLHIIGAIGWMGAAMVFGMLIGPTILTLSPASRGELIVKLFPKYVRYAEGFGVFTVVFGLAVAASLPGGMAEAFSPSTRLGTFISAGAGLAVITLIIAFAVVGPAAHKIVRLTEEMMKTPGQPPSPDLVKASTRLRVSAAIGLVLLLLVLVCMVAAAS